MHPEPTGAVLPDLARWSHPAALVRDGRIVAMSEPAVNIFGAELIGRRTLELITDTDQLEVAGRLQSREIGPPIRIGLQTASGVRLVESTWIPVGDGADPLTLVTWRDVTRNERIQAWLAAITDSSMDLIGITDTRGELLYMNDALMRLRGDIDRDTLPDGRNAIDHAAPGQSEIIENLLAELADTGQWRGQVMFQGSEGILPVDAVIERSEVGGQTVYSLIGRDMSAELRLRSELTDVIEERESFVAHVAHEIKNPLTAVEGMALVLRDETELTPPQREMLDLMIDGAADITRVVEDLADVTSGGSQPLRIASDVVDLGPLTRNVVDAIEAAHGVGVTVHGSDSCVGDELRIRQVLRNLLINAVRYGGPDIRIDVRRTDGRVQIIVSDDGDGVDDSHTESIFESFSSAHNTVAESMGVGLAVSRQLTIGMGGSLAYERRSGRTRFVVDLAGA